MTQKDKENMNLILEYIQETNSHIMSLYENEQIKSVDYIRLTWYGNHLKSNIENLLQDYAFRNPISNLEVDSVYKQFKNLKKHIDTELEEAVIK